MKQVQTDVLIIGGGTAGLAAAVAAAEKGVKVAVFEKGAVTGGTGNMAMGPLGVESRMQKERQIALTREQAFEYFMEYTHWKADANIVKAFIDKSGDTIDWLQDMGVEFLSVEARFAGSFITWHTVKNSAGTTGEGAAAGIMKVLTNVARESGVQIYLQTTTNKILKTGDKITGALATGRDEEEIEASTKAVIVATGGFGDSPEWIKKYIGLEWGKDIFSMRIPGMQGEGIKMAWEAGAAPTVMSMEQMFSLKPPFNGRGGTAEGLEAFRQPNLMVNLLGKRFMNEEIMRNTTYGGNAIAAQKSRRGFIIFDTDTKNYYQEHGMEFAMPAKVSGLDANIKEAVNKGCDSLFVADSLEELAAKTGIDRQGLQKTVNEYNNSCAMGRDELFLKSYRYLRVVKKPKFYAGRFTNNAYGTLGGFRVNEKMEALDPDYVTIPGLYGAGVDVNTLCPDSYILMLPGTTLGFALNSGRIAAENAASYARKIK